MSWLKIEDLYDRMELVTVSDADANWICGGNGGSKPQNFSISYSYDAAGATKVGDKVYNYGASADANFNFNKDNSGGGIKISVEPWNK
jgi:hypothetical protein